MRGLLLGVRYCEVDGGYGYGNILYNGYETENGCDIYSFRR